jgi:cardiolipin synthase (CMP-forming)
MPPMLLRQVPNALSIARLAATPALVLCAVLGAETAFTWILVPALITDAIDGVIARRFRLESELGARLDSLADGLLFFSAVFGVWTFHREVITAHAPACVLVIGAWVLENLAALLRYGRLSSFHTYASKAAGYVLALFIGTLFVWRFIPALFYLAVAVCVAASAEELVLVWRLPGWRRDVRGLYWLERGIATRRDSPGPRSP